MNIYMNRCLAVCNKAKGFDQNHNAGDIILNNCTGMTLKSISDKTYSYRIYEEIADGHEVRLTNCIAINDNDATDKRDKNGVIKDGEHGKYGEYGRFEVDETLKGLTVVSSEFQKAAPAQFLAVDNHEELIGPRQDDDALPETTFAHLVDGSFLIDAGTAVGAADYRGISVGGISYNGAAPDLGAYEHSHSVTALSAVAQQPSSSALSLRRTASGLLLLTVNGETTGNNGETMGNNGETMGNDFCVKGYDAAGRLLFQHPFVGRTTTLRLPATQSLIVLKVENGGRTVACMKIR